MVESVRPLLMFQGRAEEAMTFFVECGSDEEIERLAAALLDAGETFMPLGAYGFSRKFAWLSDRFGVSWQLNFN
jgi:predicted 3-demethylubiquinone-9 3-methyltransferase (glyoxalase superfamily)